MATEAQNSCIESTKRDVGALLRLSPKLTKYTKTSRSMKYIFMRGDFFYLLMHTLHVTMVGYKSEICLRHLYLH
jgi:hypothetical protein